jgi:hypothetical protein
MVNKGAESCLGSALLWESRQHRLRHWITNNAPESSGAIEQGFGVWSRKRA